MMPFTRIQRPATLSQEIVETIEGAILSHGISAGQKLPTEHELCRSFSVSRTVVREAMRMLSAKGLVTIRKRTGIYVNELSSNDATAGVGMYLALNFDKEYILYVFNVRQAVEPTVARWAATNRTPANIWEMEKNLLKLEDCGPEERAAAYTLEQEFHQMVGNATRNPVVPLMMQPVYALIPRIRELVHTHAPTTQDTVLDEHRRILYAIRQRDEDAAYHEMQMHISNAALQAHQVIDVLDATAAPGGPDAGTAGTTETTGPV